MSIKMAMVIILMPVAIERKAVTDGMSRIRGRGLEAHYSTSRTLPGHRRFSLQHQPGLSSKKIASPFSRACYKFLQNSLIKNRESMCLTFHGCNPCTR